MKFYSYKYQKERAKEALKQQALLNGKDILRIYLSYTLDELKLMKNPLYDKLIKAYPNLPNNMTIMEMRTMELLDKVFIQKSIKAIELTYKLDGSFDDTSTPPDFDTQEELTEGIK